MMNKQATSILLAMAAAAIGFGAPHTPEADAGTQRIPASACYTANNDSMSWNDGIQNNSSGLYWHPVKVFCPIPDRPGNSRTAIQSMNLAGFDANVQAGTIHDFQAKVCVTDLRLRGSHFASCSTSHAVHLDTGSPRTFDLAVPSSLVNHTRNAPFFWLANLIVQIPAHNGTPSIFYGYKVGW